MLSVNDLKGLLEVNRIVTTPFVAAAYTQQYGFSHFPNGVNYNEMLPGAIAFSLIVLATFLILFVFFDCLKLADYLLGKYQGILWSFATLSLLSFAVLGFYQTGNTHVSWHVAAGACGLYLLDAERKATVDKKATHSTEKE